MHHSSDGPRSFARSVAALLLLSAPALAQQPEPARVVAGKSTSPAASFSVREAGAGGTGILKENADLYSGDLLVALPGAILQSANGAVSVKSLADYDGRSPLPTLETAVILHPAKDTDLDLTLDRGRIDLSNTKKEGAATVRVRFWGEEWKLTLDTPGTRVALELCGRWPLGARFKPAEKPGEAAASPVASLMLLVIKGSASVWIGDVTLGLKEPPGPALVEWDSLSGSRPQSLRMEKPPDWADPEAEPSERAKTAAAAVEKFRKARAESGTQATAAFLESKDPVEQRIALVSIGAMDDIGRLARILASARTDAEWDFGITIARHWIGRSPGQAQKLYETLISPVHGYTPTHARIIMQLLFGFSADDLRFPETYEVLIEYLTHDMAAIRNLAAWHLIRLVPAGKSIGYKPGSTKAECEPVYRAWKKLVPTGQLPAPTPPEKE
jgi:hypothetical protein